MSADGAARLLGRLEAPALEELEVFRKEGRTRRFELRCGERSVSTAAERGWAVRASSADGSWFLASTDPPGPFATWPAPAPGRLRLPPPRAVPDMPPHPSLEAPLLGEVEALQLLGSIASGLADARPGAELARAVLEDGASRTEIASSRGVDQAYRHRGALFHFEAEDAEGSLRAVVQWPVTDVRTISPSAWTGRLATALSVRAAPPLDEADRGDVVLAPAVTSRVVGALSPLVVGPRAEARARRYHGRDGAVAGPAVTWVDDGRHPAGASRAPVDGEGMPTRRIVLVDRGRWRQPLVDWRDVRPPAVASGCAWRPGWRDRPEAGPTHLHWQPGEAPPGDLLAGVGRGYYLLEALDGGSFDLAEDRFELPVCGFHLRAGGAVGAFSAARLAGSIGGLLRGVKACGRDLVFASADGRCGGPSALVSGLEVRPPS